MGDPRVPAARSMNLPFHPRRRTRGQTTSDNLEAASALHFQQAKTADQGPQFLQIVARPRRKKRKEKQSKLTRVAFKVSRLMEFCTRRELQNQTGHSVDDWPLVVLKELMDNGLDGCEEAEIAPVISIAVKPGSITIQDNGTGIKPGTIKSILDYT